MQSNVSQTALPAWHKTGSLSFSDEVIEADRSAFARSESSTFSTRLENIAFAISVLRGKLDKACLVRSRPQPVRKIFQQGRILDQDLIAWRVSVPREWETFSVISSDEGIQPLEDAPTWTGYTASYPDPVIAKVMNHFRMHSIAIQTISMRCAKWIAQYGNAEHLAPEVPMPEDVIADDKSSTHLKAGNAIRTLVDGICASVPFHLGQLAWKGQNESGDIATAASSESPPVMRGPKRPAAGFMLLQPLVVAYSAPGVPADQRRWILRKTMELAKHIGMDEGMVGDVLNNLVSH